jgi:hypothetical protein
MSFVISNLSFGQRVSTKLVSSKLVKGQLPVAQDFGFEEHKVVNSGDTVVFYTYKKPSSNPSSIYITLPGTAAEAIYSYHKDTDSTFWFSSLTSFDFSYLPDDFLFVIAAKPGFGFFGNGDVKEIPRRYSEKTSLQDRVMRADVAINNVLKNIIKKPKQVVVFGYSEGFYVGAKLATVNKSITHLGIGGGGGYIDFYDFLLFNQKDSWKGEKNEDSVLQKNDRLISRLRQVMTDPDSTKFTSGYTYKRWASFAEPPIQNLAKLSIPIYQVHGTKDESTPIESAYIVPLEFARLKKDNLTLKFYANADHSLIERKSDGTEVFHWNDMMVNFFKWVAQNPIRTTANKGLVK